MHSEAPYYKGVLIVCHLSSFTNDATCAVGAGVASEDEDIDEVEAKMTTIMMVIVMTYRHYNLYVGTAL